MNTRHLHPLFDDSVQSVSVVFQADGKPYTYLTTQEVKAGQPVVVSHSGDINQMDLKVAYAVDDSGPLDIDLNSNIDYKHIVDVVDVDSWKMVLSDHSKKILAARKMEKQRARVKMRKEIMEAYADQPELLEQLVGRPIITESKE